MNAATGFQSRLRAVYSVSWCGGTAQAVVDGRAQSMIRDRCHRDGLSQRVQPVQMAEQVGRGLGQVAGRLVYTALAHRASLVLRTTVVFGLVTISTAVLAVVQGPVALLIGVSMFAGVGRGIATLLQATAITDRWGPRAYGHLSGLLGLPVLLAAAAAPWAGAVFAEAAGSYQAAFLILAGLAGAGTVLLIISTRTGRPVPVTALRG